MKQKLPQDIGLVLGWREWAALPNLGITAIKAKMDTGARSCALHATDICPYINKGEAWVKFLVWPRQSNSLSLECFAPVVDRRKVTNSGGHTQERWTVRTVLQLGPLMREVDLTLTDREGMRFRMLIGRAALDETLISGHTSYLLGATAEQRNFIKSLKPKA